MDTTPTTARAHEVIEPGSGHRRTTAALRLASLVVGAGLLLAACAEAAPEPRDITVGLSDYAFDGLPGELAAGSTLTVRNDSDTELHELVAIRLPDDEERSAEELVALPPPELAAFFPGVRAVLLQAPGADDVIAAEGDGSLTEPGRYLVICAIPTGADPGAYLQAAAETEGGPPDVPGGPPHIAEGMFAELVVTG